MIRLYRLKNPRDNFRLLAFRYQTLNYSVEALKSRKRDLKNNPILKNKIDNYLLMERLGFEQSNKNEVLPFDLQYNAEEYLKNPSNVDLKNYITICKHIVAKKLDMDLLCSRVILENNFFTTDGKDLFCLNSNFSTINSGLSDMEKVFLIACCKREKRIISDIGSIPNGVISIYNKEVERGNLLTTI